MSRKYFVLFLAFWLSGYNEVINVAGVAVLAVNNASAVGGCDYMCGRECADNEGHEADDNRVGDNCLHGAPFWVVRYFISYFFGVWYIYRLTGAYIPC